MVMDTNIFWEIIGNYNNQTIIIQILLFVLLIFSFIISYTGKINWLLKLMLGITNIYMGIIFLGFMVQKKYKNILLCRYS